MTQKIKNLGIENNPEQKKLCRKLFQTTYSQSNPTKPPIKCLGDGMRFNQLIRSWHLNID